MSKERLILPPGDYTLPQTLVVFNKSDGKIIREIPLTKNGKVVHPPPIPPLAPATTNGYESTVKGEKIHVLGGRADREEDVTVTARAREEDCAVAGKEEAVTATARDREDDCAVAGREEAARAREDDTGPLITVRARAREEDTL
ncbi:hypothetical protein RIF29_41171 [Crotalaria pallida]|uniref:Uncharacterized protein n=1 Tax=Crotalaria pallida TaxID=3830 RepID=A0AAN9EAS0_CROPI